MNKEEIKIGDYVKWDNKYYQVTGFTKDGYEVGKTKQGVSKCITNWLGYPITKVTDERELRRAVKYVTAEKLAESSYLKYVLKAMCDKLEGWNFSCSDTEGLFDFYSKDGKAILTMVLRNGEIKLVDDVEYYYNDTNFENLSLNEYGTRL